MTASPFLQRRAAALVTVLLAFVIGVGLFASSAEARRGPRRKTVVYTVRRGDTLGKIAKRFHVTVPQLRRWNRLRGDGIVAGRPLRIAAPVTIASARMKDAVRMPEGEGWYLKNPDESWGTAHTVDVMQRAIAAYRAEHPDAAPVVIGDISLKRGGWFPPHRSHRDGRDIDMGLPASGNRLLTHFARLGKELDAEKAWDLLEAFLETGEVELVLLDLALQRRLHRVAVKRGVPAQALDRIFQWPRSRRTRAGVVRHAHGHADHFHFRIRRPETAPPSDAVAGAPPAGEGAEPSAASPPAPPVEEPSFTSAP